MKKLIALLLAVCLLLGLMTTAFAAGEKSDDIVILHTNDVHCGVTDGLGYAGIAAYKADMEAANQYVTLVDCGDAIQGETIGMISAGSYLVDIMNELGYDYAIFGNHEFDFKMPRLIELTKLAKYTYLSSNFKYIGEGESELQYKPYEIVTYGDKKVAYIGITTPESFTKSTPAYFKDDDGEFIYSFSEDETGNALYAAVQETVDAAIAAGADYVIALAHLGMEGTTDRWTSEAVLTHTSGITAMLDGHSHEAYTKSVLNKDGKPVVLAQTGTKLANIGKLTIAADGSVSSTLISAEDYTKKDAKIEAFIKNITDSFQSFTSEVVGKTSVELVINDENGDRIIRNQETNLGDLCADAYRIMMDADIGIMNGGGIRKTIKAGNITRDNLLSVFPWGNLPCKIELSGQTILDMLEMGAHKYPKENGGFLHVSGLKYSIQSGVPTSVKLTEKGEFLKVDGEYRVCNVQVLNKTTNEYEPLDLKKTYTLGGIDYTILYCGDGFNMFEGAKIVRKADATYTDAHMLIEYISSKLGGTVGEEYAKPQGRITVYGDITASDWYFDAACYVMNKGLMNGTSATTFAPNTALTRGMLVTVLYRMAGSPAVTGSVSKTFSDCADGQWYSDAVLWASENKIVGGYDDGTYKPTNPINRQEMAKVLYGYDQTLGLKKVDETAVTYTDAAAIPAWALEAVTYCTNAGYLTGSNGAFNPKGTATRAMGAKVLMNMTAE